MVELAPPPDPAWRDQRSARGAHDRRTGTARGSARCARCRHRRILVHVALDVDEAPAVRAAAIGALGERAHPSVDDALDRLALDDEVGTEAALALGHRRRDGSRRADLRPAPACGSPSSSWRKVSTGSSASEDAATRAVSPVCWCRSAEALARRPEVDHVLTIGRGTATDAAVGPMSAVADPLSFGMVAFGDRTPGRRPRTTWEHLPAIERGIRRALRLAAPVDVLHLRMADAGTLAGANGGDRDGHPVCFSVAPDPHNVIAIAPARGELDEESFVRLATETPRLVPGPLDRADRSRRRSDSRCSPAGAAPSCTAPSVGRRESLDERRRRRRRNRHQSARPRRQRRQLADRARVRAPETCSTTSPPRSPRRVGISRSSSPSAG